MSTSNFSHPAIQSKIYTVLHKVRMRCCNVKWILSCTSCAQYKKVKCKKVFTGFSTITLDVRLCLQHSEAEDIQFIWNQRPIFCSGDNCSTVRPWYSVAFGQFLIIAPPQGPDMLYRLASFWNNHSLPNCTRIRFILYLIYNTLHTFCLHVFVTVDVSIGFYGMSKFEYEKKLWLFSNSEFRLNLGGLSASFIFYVNI